MRDGFWEWHDEAEHERVTRGHHRGQQHGKDAAWFEGEQLAYRRFWSYGVLHGVEETYFRDGSPKTRGEFRYGVPVGVHSTWNEAGEQTDTEYVDGLRPDAIDDKKLSRALEKVAKADDSYAAKKALDEVVGWRERGMLVYRLWKTGEYDVASDPNLWEDLNDAAGLFSADDLLAFLGDSTHEKVCGEHLTFWDQCIDQLAMRVYEREPGPIDQRWQELPEPNRVGMAFVRARFGNDVGEALAGQMDALAKKHIEDSGLYDRILWPVEGHVEEQRLFDLEKDETPLFDEFLDLFGGRDAFVETLRAYTELAAESIGHGIDLRVCRPLVETATVDEMKAYCTGMALKKDFSQDYIAGVLEFPAGIYSDVHAELTRDGALFTSPDIDVTRMASGVDELNRRARQVLTKTLSRTNSSTLRKALTEWRNDDAETIAQIALGIDDSVRRWPAICCAVLAFADEGKPVPTRLVDAFELASDSLPSFNSWYERSVAKLPEEFRSDPHHIANQVKFTVGQSVPDNAMIHQALSVLSEAQVRSIFERHISNKYDKLLPLPYLYLVEDAELWQHMIELVEAEDSFEPHYARGFGELGYKVVPLLEAALDRAKTEEFKEGWWQAIICALTRAAVDGEELPTEVDRHIRVDGVKANVDYKPLSPFILRLFYTLPTERAVPLLIDALDSSYYYFWRALPLVSSHPTEAVLEKTFTRLLELESTMMSEEQSEALAFAMKGLPNPVDWTRWILQSGGGSGCRDALKAAVGHERFEALEKQLAEAGIELAPEMDDIDKLVELADTAGGDGERLYLLRRHDEEPPAKTLNVLGGPAPGIGADRWPLYDDEPMEHLFTLDLDTLPELKARYDGMRTISVFCHQPDYNKAWTEGNSWTAVVFSTADELGASAEPPEEIKEAHEAWFEVVPIDADLANDDVHDKIYQAGARVLGPPIWLQGEDYWGDFIMQFDETFAHMNLGDMGIMYVFADTAFWQCH